jgi:tetratricopeptide (TPR) repeat protein
MDMAGMWIYLGHASPGDDAFGRELVAALRGAGGALRYEVFDAQNGRTLIMNEGQQPDSPTSIFVLSPEAVQSAAMRDLAQAAQARAQREPLRIVLPVVAAALAEADIWPWLRAYPRVEAAPGQPCATGEAIQRTLRALALAPTATTWLERLLGSGEPAAELRLRGKALHWQGDDARAAATLRRAARKDRHSLDGWLSLGALLEGMGQWRRALGAYARATQVAPANARVWYDEARALAALGRRSRALAACERATSLDPGVARAWQLQGRLLVEGRRPGDALAAFQRALHLEPGMASAWVDMAVALRMLGRLGEAQEVCDRAIELEPGAAGAWVTLAGIFDDQHQAGHALAAYERALELEPGDPAAWNAYATALAGVKRYPEAVAAFDRALALAPDLAPARQLRAATLQAMG